VESSNSTRSVMGWKEGGNQRHRLLPLLGRAAPCDSPSILMLLENDGECTTDEPRVLPDDTAPMSV
jgi:hypothetical protein